MKRIVLLLLVLPLLAGSLDARAENMLGQAAETARASATVDGQLAALYDLSVRCAAELENGGWDAGLTFEPAGEIPAAFLPDLKNAAEAESLPEELKEAKFIALYRYGGPDGNYFLLGGFQARLPEANRASSLEEAEAVLFVSERLEARPDYVGSASNRIYEIFAAPIGGAAVRLYEKTTAPPVMGTGTLTGEKVPDEALWRGVQPAFYGTELTVSYPEGTAFFRITGEGCCMAGLEGEFLKYEIPREVGGYPVLGIEKIQCDTLEELTLPEGLAYISGDFAVSCKQLKHMNFPSTLKRITGKYALDCPLQELNLNEGLEEIGAASVMGGAAREVSIPSTLAVLPESFLNQGARQLWIVVPDGVTRLERRFLWVNHWVRYVWIPESVSFFGDQIMTDGAVRIYTPEGSAASRWAAERGHEWVACEKPEDMPKPEVCYEGEYTYYVNEEDETILLEYAGRDEEVAVPDKLGGCPIVSVYSSAFYELNSLTSVRLPETVRHLGRYAFWYCRRLRSLYIPASVVEMESNAVDNCPRCAVYAPEGSEAHRWTEREKLNGEKYEWIAWDGAE